jgi:pseudouridine-5'-phosphate glycosidase
VQVRVVEFGKQAVGQQRVLDGLFHVAERVEGAAAVDPEQAAVARMMRAKWSLGIAGGISIANPIPPANEIPAATIERAINEALRAMAERKIAGKEATPFMLAKVNEITGGDSLKANVALVENNARLAAEIAAAYALAMVPAR